MMVEDILTQAEKLLTSGKNELSVLKTNHFETEDEQHDDDLIDSTIEEYSNFMKSLSVEIEKRFGPPKLIELANNFDDDEDLDDQAFEVFDDEEDEVYIPNSFASIIWEFEDCILYLAVCQADRECPINLVVGVEYD